MIGFVGVFLEFKVFLGQFFEGRLEFILDLFEAGFEFFVELGQLEVFLLELGEFRIMKITLLLNLTFTR